MKLNSTLYGIARSKFFRRPFYIRFHITHRCNYACRMCDQHKHNHQKELGLDQIRDLAADIASMGPRHLVITGGEPFLRKDLPDVIAAFKEHNFSIRVQTNGGPQVSESMLEACARAGLQDLSVSLDTLNPETQDHICRAENVLDNALRTLCLSQKILPDSISQANVVASRYNFEELPDLVRYFSRIGVYTYITPVMIAAGKDKNVNNNYLFRSRDTGFTLENLDGGTRDRIIGELIRLRQGGMGITNSTRYLKDYRQYLLSGQCAWQCEAGTLCLDVLPDGGVSVCKEKPAMGNLCGPDFMAYYRSRQFHEYVSHTTTSCKGCFYGEYREPQYAVRDLSVLYEWGRDWFRVFRKGMQGRKSA